MTFISRLIGVALTFGVAGHVQAVESLPVRDSADFNYQLNGDVAPPAISGSVVWSADGDILTFNRNLGAGTFGWNNVLNHGLGYTFEMRFRITEPESSGLGVFGIILADQGGPGSYHAHRFSATNMFTEGGAAGQPMLDGVDFTDGFHVMRFVEKPGVNGLSIWLDGELIYEDRLSFNNAFNRVYIGSISGAITEGIVEFDYIRLDTTGAYRPVPEPASIALLSIGALMLRRRYSRD